MTPIRLNPTSHLARFAAADWLRDIEPNLAVTLTLKQGVSIFNGKHLAWVHGDQVQYERAYSQLIHRVSKRSFRHAFKRHKKLIPNFATLEGDGVMKRLHIHGAIRCPNHISFDDMDKMFREEWQRSEWAMPDVKIEPIVGNWVDYALKDGTDALILDGLRF